VYRSNHFVSQDDGKAVVGDASLTNHRPLRQPPLREQHQNQMTSLSNGQQPNGVAKHDLHPNNMAFAPPSPLTFDRSLRLDDRADSRERNDAPPALPLPPLERAPHKDQAGTAQEQLGAICAHGFRDEQISDLFVAMARASQLPKDQLAQRLQTSVSFLDALEAGALDQLPEWEEISEVILRYTHLIQIDERPILRRLREQLTEYYLTSMSQMQSQLPTHVAEQNHQPAQRQTGKTSSIDPRQTNLDRGAHSSEQLRFVQSALPAGPHAHVPHSFSPNKLDKTRNEATNHHTPMPFLDAGHSNAAHRPEVMRSPGDQRGAAFQAPVPMHNGVPMPYGKPKTKGLSRTSMILANIAFIVILLFGFIQWQPNRFWSGVDQLPKPIAETIYSVFEMVMPDPFASTLRMNWVHVDDPRMRKADRLFVPAVKRLPKIDFSNLGTLNQLP